MLLRLLGLVVLSALSLTEENRTQFFNEETQSFDSSPPEWVMRMQRSLDSNYTDRPMNNMMGPNPNPNVMFPDTSICDVILTSQENVSIDQIPFFCMCSQCKASTGLKGERGDRGPPGFPGSPGRRGIMGFRGPRGFTGPPGTKGQKGDQGEKGQAGRIGYPGMKGALGVKGAKGDHGDDGPIGPLGPQGVAGSCLCEPITGPPGLQGPPGPPGARGLPGTTGSKGMAGAKGDKGDMGLVGRDGTEGLKGAKGDLGPCDCADGKNGTIGAVGEKGEVGIKGSTGPKGDVGAPGEPGETGDPGLPGIPGPCSLAVQSAFTVALETSFPIANRPVRFPRIIYNVQGHFNPVLGMYLAPVNGTYTCAFHLAVKEKILVVRLFRDFSPVLTVTGSNDMNTVSHSVVLRLRERSLVWLQVRDSDSNGMFVDVEVSSTFSCFLIRPDSCEMGIFRDFNDNMDWEAVERSLFLWEGTNGNSNVTPNKSPTEMPSGK